MRSSANAAAWVALSGQATGVLYIKIQEIPGDAPSAYKLPCCPRARSIPDPRV